MAYECPEHFCQKTPIHLFRYILLVSLPRTILQFRIVKHSDANLSFRRDDEGNGVEFVGEFWAKTVVVSVGEVEDANFVLSPLVVGLDGKGG